MNVKELSVQELRDGIALADLADSNVARAFAQQCSSELGSRITDRRDRLWKARMEIQYAENELRHVKGLPAVQITSMDALLPEEKA